MVAATGGLLAGGLEGIAPGAGRDPAKLRKVAAEFEALLIAQLLRTVRESSGEGWLGSGGGSAGATMAEVAEQQLAQALASGGGLGLAELVASGLEQPGEQAAQSARDRPIR